MRRGKTRFIFLLGLLLLLAQCGEQDNPDFRPFSELSASDSLKWHNKLMDAIHAEMVDSVKHYTGCFWGCCALQDSANYLIINLDEYNFCIDDYPQNIPSALFEFYLTNIDSNDRKSRRPFYNHLYKNEILKRVENAKNELKRVEEQYNDSGVIKYYNAMLLEWEILNSAVSQIKSNHLPQIHGQALVILEGSSRNPELHRQINHVLVESYFWLREERAQKLFKKSYLELFYLEQTRNKQVDRNRILTLQTIIPLRVRDHDYCRKHNCCRSDYPRAYPTPDVPPAPQPEDPEEAAPSLDEEPD
jgi:hypothetical protein